MRPGSGTSRPAKRERHAATAMNNMSIVRWLGIILTGLIAGLAAMAFVALLMAAGRYWLGISPPVESIPDRVARLLDIKTFFSLFGKYGGYSGLKRFGIVSGLRGLATAGAAVGVIYALIAEAPFSRRSPRHLLGTSLPALLFVTISVAVVWVGMAIFLWPVLGANYRGLPPTPARLVTLAAMLVWYTSFGLLLIGLYRWMTGSRPRPAPVPAELAPAGTPVSGAMPVGMPITRRAAITAVAGGALVYPTYRIIKSMESDATFTYDGTPYSGEGIQPITPTAQFYSVTKNVVDPDVDKRVWGLEIGGLVEHGKSYGFDDLKRFEQVDQETTLMCISNRIGAGLFSNANWHGVRLKDVLEESTPKDGAVEILMSAADGYQDSIPFEKAMDPTTLLVYEINGEPLPRKHGYPVRLLVPGMFGEKNVKWITRIDVVDHDAKGFYEQQGWGPHFVPPTRSDIFSPRTRLGGNGFTFVRQFKANQTVEIKGRAFAGDRGIRSVEFSTDNGENWRPATIYYPGTRLTWALWSATWTPTSTGTFVITSRAVDGTGAPQPQQARGIVPQGAQGYHRVKATVV